MSSTAIPQRLYLMHVASAPPAMGGVPVVCYLVQTSDGRNILIDSGLPPKEYLPPELEPTFGKDVVEQLATLGLQPADIDTLICTHFDLDHSGHHDAFTRAQFVVQRTHYEHALTAQRFARTRLFWDIPSERYHFVDGDTELLDGLQLIETNGHAVGHQSVLVRLPETGSILLAIDAIANQNNCTPEVKASPMDHDETALRRGVTKLLTIAEREHVSMVVFGHDTEQWQTLKKLPEFYS